MHETPTKEPIFNAPILAFLIPAVIIALYALQRAMGPQLEDALLNSFALSSPLLRQGQYELLVTYQFLHGSWSHVLFNAVFCLAFATPLTRAVGRGLGALLSYLAFFLICGAVAGLGHCLLNWRDPAAIIGASGAVSGIIAAAMRLRGDGRLNGFLSKRVVGMTVIYIGVNAASALVPLTPGAGGVLVAWQAHIVGYIAGLVLIEPWLRLFHRRYFTLN
ncbi:rhomboid family protein [Asticcacaulis biprosthecium C19]|uniref:Rhomboid family protein n=1 Tax=Asticcacaulis biprosthecium C19 TaxID=715226 RepID=F4QSA2_9CAUL|nr:rhomboid family intramembrane serine protease [Asticcacaulis biprosthecium]EGF89622.1 rhomboid family protein [Asticcacaulis biprosthecium C19]